MDITLIDVEIPASITSVSAEQAQDNDHKITVSWESKNTDNQKIALYLCDNSSDVAGRKLVENINVNEGSYEYILPESLASGNYYVNAVLYEDGTNYSSMTSEDEIIITDEYQPDRPSNLQVEAAGNGALKVEWEDDQEADGYYIEVRDENNEPLDGVGAIEVEGGVYEAYIGGTYTDEDGNPMGMAAGNSYIIALTAYREVDGIDHYSEEVYAQPVYLPSPEPPILEFDVEADDGNVIVKQDTSGNDTYVVNSSGVDLLIESDQQVEVELLLDDGNVVTGNGKQISMGIDLLEGENLIQVKAVNDNGDSSVYVVSVKCDITAPELKVESVEKTAVEDGTEIRVKGTAELGAYVTVNGEAVTVGQDGVFEIQMPMGDVMEKEISVVTWDEAGNESRYSTIVYNNSVNNLDKIEIQVAEQENSSAVDAVVGDELQLELYGTDEMGGRYLIEAGDARWSLLTGKDSADISEDGLLDLLKEDEIIVAASYSVSEVYTFEDALTVKAVNGSGDSGGSGEYEGDDFKPITENEEPSQPQEPDNDDKDRNENSIDNKLRQVLSRLIENQENSILLKRQWLSGKKDNEIQADNNMSITIPGQEIDTNFGFGVWKVRDTSEYERENMNIVGSIYEIVLHRTEKLDKSALMEFRYDPEQVDEADNLAVYRYNEKTERWEYIGGKVDRQNHTVRVSVDHFSKYALVSNPELTKFSDIKGRWSGDLIYRLASTGIVNGIQRYGKYYYEPDRDISRQEFVTMIVMAADADLDSFKSLNGYIDKSLVEQWALPFVKEAVGRGWLSGVEKTGNKYIEPLREITRAEASVLIGKVLENMGCDIENNRDTLQYEDMDSIPDWAANYVKLMYQSKIMQGYPDNTFGPDRFVTREEAAVMIVQLMDCLNNME